MKRLISTQVFSPFTEEKSSRKDFEKGVSIMFIQGNLQAVFDALYTLGAIDPVLKMDWSAIVKEMSRFPDKLQGAVATVNSCGGEIDALIENLKALDPQARTFIAMEVAREFAEYQDRSTLH